MNPTIMWLETMMIVALGVSMLPVIAIMLQMKYTALCPVTVARLVTVQGKRRLLMESVSCIFPTTKEKVGLFGPHPPDRRNEKMFFTIWGLRFVRKQC